MTKTPDGAIIAAGFDVTIRGMEQAIAVLQAELDRYRALRAGLTGPQLVRRGRPPKALAEYAAMEATAPARKDKRRSEEQRAKMSAIRKAYWENLTPKQRKERQAVMQAGRTAKALSKVKQTARAARRAAKALPAVKLVNGAAAGVHA